MCSEYINDICFSVRMKNISLSESESIVTWRHGRVVNASDYSNLRITSRMGSNPVRDKQLLFP